MVLFSADRKSLLVIDVNSDRIVDAGAEPLVAMSCESGDESPFWMKSDGCDVVDFEVSFWRLKNEGIIVELKEGQMM